MSKCIVLSMLLISVNLFAQNTRSGGEGPMDRVDLNSPQTCPPDTWPLAVPHLGGTLVCNTTWPQSQCPCKKCERVAYPYTTEIFYHLYPAWGDKKKYTYEKDFNPVEKWVEDNRCGKTAAPSPVPSAVPNQAPDTARPQFIRPLMNVGDQQDCELLSSDKDVDLKAKCEAQVQRTIASAGKCSGYFEKRARQGGQGYDGGGQASLNEQDGPRLCELLVASDALTDEVRAALARSQALERRSPSDADVEDCRGIINEDTQGSRYCFDQLNRAIRNAGKCKYFMGAKFRQGETCPLPGQRMNTFSPKTSAPATR